MLNSDKHYSRSIYQMNIKYMVLVAAMAVTLIGATALASTGSAFAGGHKKYEKSQALSQANACGNGKLPLNVFCDNTASQVQGDENGVALTGNQQAQDNGFDGGDHHGHGGHDRNNDLES
ncbi:MAG: hypothetical protein WBX01_09565 [Nitrososphaeraceae archaeon]